MRRRQGNRFSESTIAHIPHLFDFKTKFYKKRNGIYIAYMKSKPVLLINFTNRSTIIEKVAMGMTTEKMFLNRITHC